MSHELTTSLVLNNVALISSSGYLQGGTPQPSTSSQSTTTEHTVRVPNNCKKRYSMIKFSTGADIDFLKQVSKLLLE